MSQSHIRIRGARTHNLKNVSLDIPRDKFVVITGLSGSGKSSLAFDTLYAEGQRRYVESLSAYARQFLSQMEKPEVDSIEGLSPAIAIEQKSTSHNPRSTVGTITEIYDYLRLLYARVGTPYCPEHDLPMVAQTVSEMVDAVKNLEEGTALMLLAPVVRERKGEYSNLFEQLQGQGFVRARVDGEIIDIDTPPELDKKKKHTIEVVVDRFKVRDDLGNRIAESFETALRLGGDIAVLSWMNGEHPDRVFSAKHSCPECDRAVAELEPRLFSFNNPFGACPVCDGLGTRSHFSPEKLIPNPELAISEGAIRGWDRQRPYYYSMLQKVADHFGFQLDTPWNQLDKDTQKKFLQGTGKEKIDLSYIDERGRKHTRVQPFEGILPHLERRYRETESNYVRDDLAQYLSNAACDACGGSRLNEISRHVRVKDKTIADITRMSIGDAESYYQGINLE
ncbi:MAG: excinuclease ABC subunit UvrA, partial [Acinetobacter baumannii]